MKYSFNEMVYSLGLWRGFLVHMTDRVKPLWVYGAFFLLICTAVFLLKKKDDRFKIIAATSATSFIFTFFLWNMASLLHSSSGRLYSLITVIILSASIGSFFALKYQKAKTSTEVYSRISTFLVITALFFIFTAVYFEFSLSPPAVASSSIITFIGSFFLTAAIYSGVLSFQSETGQILFYSFLGSAGAFPAAVFILPVMGLVEVFPLNIIFLLGLVFLLNTQQSA